LFLYLTFSILILATFCDIMLLTQYVHNFLTNGQKQAYDFMQIIQYILLYEKIDNTRHVWHAIEVKDMHRINYDLCVYNATFNNNSVILWRSVLLVEETRENHQPVTSQWQTLSHNVVKGQYICHCVTVVTLSHNVVKGQYICHCVTVVTLSHNVVKGQYICHCVTVVLCSHDKVCVDT
jgi:hypothetical protein